MQNYDVLLQITAFECQVKILHGFSMTQLSIYLQRSRKSENQHLAVNGALERLHATTVNNSFIVQ
jgi:hypothetical protein